MPLAILAGFIATIVFLKSGKEGKAWATITIVIVIVALTMGTH